eukprot:TRINITY_DN1272_c0_g1_i1.p1 TRINITY_DN1272_c0_g1~~TRINITY_DN1272_c0_g1_i1.p1  ORF type:complete len:755 (-),score=168.13 TRINITY_DN1272_c0_g1_i1:67-2331(-)
MSKEKIKFRWSGRGLDKKDLFGKSDPFLVISRANETGQYVPVFKTEVIKKTLDPDWALAITTTQALTNGDYLRPMLFECYDWNKSGRHDFIGSFTTTLQDMKDGMTEWELINKAKKSKKKSYKNSGVIVLRSIEFYEEPSFLDYIAGGMEMNLLLAIDFTASNGNPTYPNSLHYNNPSKPNEYAQAIQAVGEILLNYDSDRMVPVYGFGAKVPPNYQVSHCFALNGNESDPEVYEIQGILQAYYQSLNSVSLYGPTIFSEIIKVAAAYAGNHCTQEDQQYYILLIITDGVINDMDQTIDAIVGANHLPLSIIIVGVGTDDFEKMDILDADDEPLCSSSGVFCKRDIVQFVPYRKFHNNPAALAAETLEEIPEQVVSYMMGQGITPNEMSVGIQFQPREVQPEIIETITTTTSVAPNFEAEPEYISPSPITTVPQNQGNQGYPPQHGSNQTNNRLSQGFTSQHGGYPPQNYQNTERPQTNSNGNQVYPPQHGSNQSYPPHGSNQGYPPQDPGYPPQGNHDGYPPQNQGYPPNNYLNGRPQTNSNGNQGYPPQGNQGYPPQHGSNQGFPPQHGSNRGYPPHHGSNQGYPPQNQESNRHSQGYPPQHESNQGYPPQNQQNNQYSQGYPPHGSNPGYPPQGNNQGYPPQHGSNPGYPPQGNNQGYPPQHGSNPGYPQNYQNTGRPQTNSNGNQGYPPQHGSNQGYPQHGSNQSYPPQHGSNQGYPQNQGNPYGTKQDQTLPGMPSYLGRQGNTGYPPY